MQKKNWNNLEKKYNNSSDLKEVFQTTNTSKIMNFLKKANI